MTDSSVKTQLVFSEDHDLVEDVIIPVEGENPPEELAKAVHAAFEHTIIHFCEGRSLRWSQDENGNWELEVVGGMPEHPVEPDTWVHPYRTKEKFIGADNSGEGLIGNLPTGWERIGGQSVNRVKFKQTD